MNNAKLTFDTSGNTIQAASVASLLVAIFITGCATSAQSIKAFDTEFRSLETQAREDMLAYRHAIADANFAKAAAEMDQTTKAYVDGFFYLDQARIAGNRAFMAVLDGNRQAAREFFESSRAHLTSGIQAHEKALLDRTSSRQNWTTGILSVAAGIGIGSRGDEIENVEEVITSLVEFIGAVSDSIAKFHKELDVDENARYVDPDVWRAALISDHPVSQAVVRVVPERMGRSGLCTGFYVQPRLIATSAHCVPEPGKGDLRVEVRNPRGEKQLFLLGKSAKLLTVEAWYRAETYDEDSPPCQPDDWALIVVSENDQSDHWLPLNVQPLVDGSQALLIGYSGDLDNGFFQRIDYGCKLAGVGRRPGMIGTTCASAPGNSGGPLISADDSRAGMPYRVVGIQSCLLDREFRGQRGPGPGFIVGAAAGIAPLAEFVRAIIAEQPSLGDVGSFQ